MDDNWGYPYDFGNIQIGIDWEGPQIYAMFKREKNYTALQPCDM